MIYLQAIDDIDKLYYDTLHNANDVDHYNMFVKDNKLIVRYKINNNHYDYEFSDSSDDFQLIVIMMLVNCFRSTLDYVRDRDDSKH